MLRHNEVQVFAYFKEENKNMSKVLPIAIVFTIILAIFAGCQEAYDPNTLYNDPLSEEVKTKIKNWAVIEYDWVIHWDYENPYYGNTYYGTINNCIILRNVGNLLDIDGIPLGHFEIAGYVFDWKNPFLFYAFRDGEICKLTEAYEKGWLTQEQIGKIHARHTAHYAKYLDEREEMQAEATDESFAGYEEARKIYLYGKAPSGDQKQAISDALLSQQKISVDWDAFYTYYGMINGCTVLMTAEREGEPSYRTLTVADQTFEWQYPFGIYVYRDGTACTLEEAYEQGWLTEYNIAIIRMKNIQYYAQLIA